MTDKIPFHKAANLAAACAEVLPPENVQTFER